VGKTLLGLRNGLTVRSASLGAYMSVNHETATFSYCNLDKQMSVYYE
jgi:hypothetical protein